MQSRHHRDRLEGEPQDQGRTVPVTVQQARPPELDPGQLRSGAHADVQRAGIFIGGFGPRETAMGAIGGLGCRHNRALPRQGDGEERADRTAAPAGAAIVVTELHRDHQ